MRHETQPVVNLAGFKTAIRPHCLRQTLSLSKSVLALLLSLLLSACDSRPEPNSLYRALGNSDTEGYLRAQVVRPFHFPEDHSAHPGYKNEWWYLTGNVQSDKGQQFGYQVTFFRIALSPESLDRESRWATNHLWMAHAAITDITSGKHLKSERFSRGAADLAGNTSDPFRVWLDDWQLTGSGPNFPWYLNIKNDQFSLALEVAPKKPVVLQGNNGLSQKSPEPGNASYYYSITRMETKGKIQIHNHQYQVSGDSWLDREWGTSLLAKDQVGWDWFSLQFDNNQEMMFYQLRKPDGSAHTSSRGTWVDGKGAKTDISPEDIDLKPLQWWTAPNGAQYPIRWKLSFKSRQKEWIVAAAIPNQWMDVAIKYWEGSVQVFNANDTRQIGRGYLEMTGY